MCFIEELRHYVQHEQLPAFYTEVMVKPDEIAHAVKLNTAVLSKAGKDFTSPSKAYITAAGDGIDLLETIIEYHGEIRGFYAWFFSYKETMHGAEIDGLNKLIDEYNAPFRGHSD